MLNGKELGQAIEKAFKLKKETGAISSKADIALHFGIKTPSVYDWVKKGSISKDKLSELFRYFSDVVDYAHWGMTEDEWPAGLKTITAGDSGRMAAAIWSDDGKTKQVVKQKDLPRATPHQHTKQRVKILDAAAPYIIPQYQDGGSMGHGLALPDQPGIIENWSVNREWLNKNVRHFTAAGNLCIVTGFGPSMQPMFNPGDPLLVDLGVTSVIADGVYFFRVGREGFIKQLQKIPTSTGTKYIAKSKNPDFDPFDITPDMDFEVIGRVVRIWCGTDF